MRREKVATIIAAAAVISVLALIYGPATSTAQLESPCAEDMKNYCGDVTKGGGRLLQCYEANMEKMSAGCKAWAEMAKANAVIVKEACSKELDARCNFEKGDPLAMVNCLQSNYVDLSVKCREKLTSFKGMYPLPVN